MALEDTSIVSYRNFPDKRKSPSIKSTHFLYQNLLEGFAGFSTILVLYIYISESLKQVAPGDVAILTPFILTVLPIFVTGLFGIPMILYEKLLPDIILNVQKTLKDFNFPIIKIPDFNDLKN